jgi:hypothetical protein
MGVLCGSLEKSLCEPVKDGGITQADKPGNRRSPKKEPSSLQYQHHHQNITTKECKEGTSCYPQCFP